MEKSVSVSSDRIFEITSGGGPLISVGIFRPEFAVPFLINRLFALIRKLGRGIKSGKSDSYWLALFNRKMPFHFPRVFPLISDRLVWHNGRHPWNSEFRSEYSNRSKGCLPFISKKFRKFQLKVKWNSNFPENPFRN